MIELKHKKDCVGCNACAQKCPVKCICMNEDEQGFLYPTIDLEKCVNCGICEKVCPVIHQGDSREPQYTYAAYNHNKEVLMASSSGGVFYALAKIIIDEGGVVFGAKFNEKWEVIHDYSETLEGVRAFQGSKYVQSCIGNSYRDAERFLKNGRKVMYSGTPCQIAGLVLFLKNEYEGLLLKVEVICHGVPSPMVWRDYLNTISQPNGADAGDNSGSLSLNATPHIGSITFRDKRMGWEKYGLAVRLATTNGNGKNMVSQSAIRNREYVFFENHRKNLFMNGFFKDLYLRPSCFECPSKSGKSHADISLGDFWNIGLLIPDFYNENGVSLVLCYGEYAKKIVTSSYLTLANTDYPKALSINKAIIKSAVKPPIYEDFWNSYLVNKINAVEKYVYLLRPSLKVRLRRIITDVIKRILGKKLEILISLRLNNKQIRQ